VTSLTNGTSYTFTVHATNAAGNGPESAPSNAVTPSTIPGKPTNVTAVAGNTQATVSFTAPSDGGLPITGYTVTSNPGSFTGTGASSPIDVIGLTNGTSYTFTLHATNANGDGPESDPSNPVTPCTVPGAPTGVVATGDNALAIVAFTAPVDDGGAAITGYTVTSTPGSITASGASSPIIVTSLTNGTSYTFTVHATNAAGNGPESAPSNSVTPTAPTPPGPPPSDVCASLDHLIITPGSTILQVNAGTSFKVRAYDANGILLSGIQFTWTANGASILGIEIGDGDGSSVYYVAPADPGNYWIRATGCGMSETVSFSVVPYISAIILSVSPDEAYLRPSQTQQYSARVSDQGGNDITSVCPVTWSMQTPAAGSIDSSGKMTATSALGVWNNSVKATTSCFGLSDFQLMTFVTTNEERRLDYVWTNPWNAAVQDPIKSVQFSVRGYDQFFLRIDSDITYSFSLLDDRIGSIPSNGRVVNIATSENYGCYPNKIKATASYKGVEKSAFGSVSIYPANYAFNSGGSGCKNIVDLKDKILAGLIGADRSYAAEGQVFTHVSYEAPKYIEPGQNVKYLGVPRDQVYTPISGVKVEYILHNPNAGQLSSIGTFIATTNLGSYPGAVEIKASKDDKTISKTFDVVVTDEQKKATTIRASGPTGSTELTTNRVIKMWKGSNYSFYNQLRDQFNNLIAGPSYATIEDVSGKNLVDILGPTTLRAKDTEGVFKDAIKVTYDIDQINQRIPDDQDKILGPSPSLYLSLDIHSANDNPTVCLSFPPDVCPPDDPDCIINPPNPPICIGNICITNPWIKNIINFLSKILHNTALATKINIAAVAAAITIPLLLILLSAPSNLLPFLKSSQIISYFVKGRDKKYARGLVYEANTGLPLPGVKILLFRVRDRKLQSVATSTNQGKFALIVPTGEEYYLETRSDSFDQIKENRSGMLQKFGLKYSNNYFGEHFKGRDANYYFDRSIPLIANAKAPLHASAIHKIEIISKILRILNVPLLIAGFSFSLLAFSSNKSLINSIVIGLYIVIFIYYIILYFVIRGRSNGLVYKKADNSPIDLAVVRAISETSGKLVKTTVSDSKGRFALALPKGYYNIVAVKANLQQENIIKSRVRSNFTPTKAKIELSEIDFESSLNKQIPSAAPVSSSSAPARTFEDSDEIIGEFKNRL